MPEDPPRLTQPLPLLYEGIVRRALEEDLGRAGDITTDAIAPAGALAKGSIVARAPGRIAGLEVALSAFCQLDPAISAEIRIADGSDAAAGDILALLEGKARTILTAERTALNLLGRLCGIATSTRNVLAVVAPYGAKVVCTRKTTPGLRAIEKYAVRAGGGSNHRFGLDDAVLIKDNHRVLAGSLTEAVRRVRARVGHMVKIEAEVDTIAQLEEALGLAVDAVLMDNMSVPDLARGVRMAKGKAITEASGGITPETAAAVAATGVDLLSIGWLTHSAPSLDVSLDLSF